MWCTERSSGNSICHRHSSHAAGPRRAPWLTTTANSVRTALLRTSGRASPARPCAQEHNFRVGVFILAL